MAIPDATTTIRDGGLGLVSPVSDNVLAIVGVSSLGTAGSVKAYSDQQLIKDELGTGPLVEAACYALSIAGGSVVLCKSAASTVGANGSVTKTGTAGLSVMSLSGTPVDSYLGAVKIVTGAALPTSGLATFQYSLDGGRTYSSEIALPTSGSYAIPNTGLTITFSAATLGAGDVYSWVSTAPIYSTSDLNTALDALLNNAATWFAVLISGVPGDGTAGAAHFGAIASKMSTAESTKFRYVRAFFHAEDDIDANIITNYANLTSTRISPSAGFGYVTSPINGVAYKRPASWVAAARAAASLPHEDLGKVKNGVAKGVVALIRDEYKTPALDAVGFTTLRTIPGKEGYYLTTGRLKGGAGSDFQYLQLGRVMDIASTELRAATLEYLNDDLRVDKTTGKILETEARNIESYVGERMRARTTQPGYATEVSVVVDRNENMLSTGKLVTRERVTPKAYAKSISNEIAFYNPALQPV
jgi:Protein of unknown function (DUF2586)